MDSDDLAPYIFIIFFIIVPIIKGLFKHKKNNPLPQNPRDFEKKHREQKHSQHLKPFEEVELIEVKIKKENVSPPIKRESLSRSYKPGYNLESKIESKHLSSNIKSRHVESELETLSHQSLLQERFVDDSIIKEKKASLVKALTNKSKLKEAIILSEILKRRF